ncbi:MAG: Na+/H+ antiporter subunit B [Geminicoccales bacterium]
MNSLILQTISRFLVGLMLLFSIFLLLRGHNEPGGGFIGGLVAAAGIIVYGIADGPAAVRKILRVDPRVIAMTGLLTAIIAGLVPVLVGTPFLTGLWTFIGATSGDKGLAIGTPLLFDIGVYLVVIGGVLGMVIALEEEV